MAVNPYLIWYSQEARSYALLVLLCVTTVYLLAARRTALWAVAAIAALATHYFAGFVLVPEALWLIYRERTRTTALAIGAVALAGAALAPLALHQRASGSTTFISDFGLGSRLSTCRRSSSPASSARRRR